MTAVFETMRVREGVLPLVSQHLRRFEANRSSAGLAPLPADLPQRLDSVSRAGPDDHVLRVEWNGESLTITTRDLPPLGQLALAVATEPHPGYAVKTTDRATFDRARAEARDRGADEALLLTESGFVAEGTIFAIGWFEGDILRVPSLDLEILPSIGRERVIDCAKRAGISVQEGRFTLSDLTGRPAFVTTSVRGVVAVSTLDGEPVPEHAAVTTLAAGFWPSA